MDDRTPNAPAPPPVVTPDPHLAEPAPPTQDGRRPEAAASNVRPEQDEPGGPLAGLVGAAGTQAATEAAPNASDTALLEQMGVEKEGIESGQLLGLIAAVIFAILALGVVLVYLFYIPFRQQVGSTASDVGQYPELEQVRTEAAAKLNQYARTDSVYQVPIEQAMGLVASRYRTAEGRAPAGLPTTRQEFNTLMLNRGTGTSVQNPAGLRRRTTVEQERLAATSGVAFGAPADSTQPDQLGRPVRTNEEVGVDGTVSDFPSGRQGAFASPVE